MRCGKFLDKLDGLDAGASLSPAMAFHALFCPSCAQAAARLEAAILAYRAPPAPDGERDSVIEDRIMAAVRLTPPPRQDFAIRDWIAAGIVIATSTLLLPLTEHSGFLRTFFGPGYALSLAIVLGLALTAYTAFFIGTHMGELRSYLDKRGLRVR